MNYVLYLVSANPQHVPTEDAIQAALDVLQNYFATHEKIESIVSPDETALEFFASGEDLESVKCNHCQSEIIEWFLEAGSSGQLWSDPTRHATLPCCGQSGYLPDLQYHAFSTYARFGLAVVEGLHLDEDDQTTAPNDLSDGKLRELESLLGCQLQRVWCSI